MSVVAIHPSHDGHRVSEIGAPVPRCITCHQRADTSPAHERAERRAFYFAATGDPTWAPSPPPREPTDLLELLLTLENQ